MKEFKIEWSLDAKDDLDELWLIIFNESKDFDTAENFVDNLILFAEERCKHPQNGTRIESLEDSYREIYFKHYTIVYEILVFELKVIIHEVYNQKRINIRSYRRDRV